MTNFKSSIHSDFEKVLNFIPSRKIGQDIYERVKGRKFLTLTVKKQKHTFSKLLKIHFPQCQFMIWPKITLFLVYLSWLSIQIIIINIWWGGAKITSKMYFQQFEKSVFLLFNRQCKIFCSFNSFLNISANFAARNKIKDIFKIRMNRALEICHNSLNSNF